MTDSGNYIIHANWCGHCIKLMDSIKDYSTGGNKYLFDKANVEVFEQNDLENDRVKKILGGYQFSGFPTIIRSNGDGKSFDEFKGDRTPENLIEFFNKTINGGKKRRRNKNKSRKRIRKVNKKRRKTKKNGIFTWLFK
jgi:thiol-disulfide isomerase/thioredoxin